MRTAIVTLVSLYLSACAYGNSSNDPLSSVTDASSTLETTEKLLQGTWSKPCQYESNNGYFIEQIAFSGVDGNFAIVTRDAYYSDAGCKTLAMVRSQSLTVANVSSNGTGYTYNATVASQSTEAVTVTAAAQLTAAHACGYTQWTAGFNADTSGTSCNTTGTMLDTISLSNGQLYRALDEVLQPSVISGTISSGLPYTKTN